MFLCNHFTSTSANLCMCPESLWTLSAKSVSVAVTNIPVCVMCVLVPLQMPRARFVSGTQPRRNTFWSTSTNPSVAPSRTLCGHQTARESPSVAKAGRSECTWDGSLTLESMPFLFWKLGLWDLHYRLSGLVIVGMYFKGLLPAT